MLQREERIASFLGFECVFLLYDMLMSLEVSHHAFVEIFISSLKNYKAKQKKNKKKKPKNAQQPNQQEKKID